jgi:hypothetical protein
MFDRWRPPGPRATVIRVDQPEPLETLARVEKALEKIWESRAGGEGPEEEPALRADFLSKTNQSS